VYRDLPLEFAEVLPKRGLRLATDSDNAGQSQDSDLPPKSEQIVRILFVTLAIAIFVVLLTDPMDLRRGVNTMATTVLGNFMRASTARSLAFFLNEYSLSALVFLILGIRKKTIFSKNSYVLMSVGVLLFFLYPVLLILLG